MSESAQQALIDFLISAFSVSELVRFIRFGPDGQQLSRNIPTQGTPVGITASYVELLVSRGLIDSDLFERLREERPNRAREIDEVAAQFLNPANASSPSAAPSVANSADGVRAGAAYRWDLFISHASEDKPNVVNPLVSELQHRGLRVWFDAHELTLGDSLRTKIDEGLRDSRFGVVVLSPSFFAKQWPKAELDGLASREMDGGKVLLPVWHGVGKSEVQEFSVLLAAKLAVDTQRGIGAVADAIQRAVERG